MNDVGLLSEVMGELDSLMGDTEKYRAELLRQLSFCENLNASMTTSSESSFLPFPTKYIERKIEFLDRISSSEKGGTTFILISGKAQHGKDTSARYLAEYLTQAGKKVLVAHYADLLKYLCKMFFEWNGEKDEKGRSLLQYVGTDCIRKSDPDYWVRFIVGVVSLFPFMWDYVIVPDTRFPNEIEYVRKSGFKAFHARVTRGPDFDNGLSEEQKKHPSEVALDSTTPDCYIRNFGDLNSLKETVKEIGAEILKA